MKAWLAGFVLMVAAPMVMAAEGDSSWYLGAGGGQSKFRDACNYFESRNILQTCDDESVGWKVFVGQRIYTYTDLELQYLDAGEATITAPSATPGTIDINPRILSLFLKVEVPLAVQGRLGFFGKAGLGYYDTEYKRTGLYATFVGTGDDGVEPAIGAGFTWRGWKHFSARIEWEHFNDVVIGNGNLDLTSVSLQFHF